MRQEQPMTYEALVAECQRLRAEAEQAEVRLFLFLVRCEEEYQSVWKEAGCTDFEQFLRSNHLVEPRRYRCFVTGLKKVGVDTAISIGIDAVIAAGAARAPETVPAIVARAEAYSEVHGVAPSEQATREWRTQLDPPPEREHGTIRRADELHQLRAENARLRAELAAVKKERDEAIAKLAGRDGRKQKTTNKRSKARATA